MGQQQLLLIVLGVIVVGIAVVVGINLFNANAETSTQDSVVSQGTNIGALAQQYYKKPTLWEDGGSFTDFNTEVFTKLPVSTCPFNRRRLGIHNCYSFHVVFTADPKDYTWTVETTVTKDEIKSTITT